MLRRSFTFLWLLSVKSLTSLLAHFFLDSLFFLFFRRSARLLYVYGSTWPIIFSHCSSVNMKKQSSFAMSIDYFAPTVIWKSRWNNKSIHISAFWGVRLYLRKRPLHLLNEQRWVSFSSICFYVAYHFILSALPTAAILSGSDKLPHSLLFYFQIAVITNI